MGEARTSDEWYRIRSWCEVNRERLETGVLTIDEALGALNHSLKMKSITYGNMMEMIRLRQINPKWKKPHDFGNDSGDD